MSLHSEYLTEGFTPNPYYDKFMTLIVPENADLFEEILGAAGDYGTFGNDIPSDLIDSLMHQFGDQLDSIVETFIDTPATEIYMPPAPPPLSLYGRISPTAKVLDIGTGDGRKAERAKVTDMVLTDKVVPVGRFSKKTRRLDATDDKHLQALAEDRILTSFMSLSQLDDITSVMKYDGFHVVPELGYIIKNGAKQHGNKVCVRTRNKVFFDNMHDYGGGTYPLSLGYMGVVNYAKRNVWIEFGNCVQLRPPKYLSPQPSPFNTDTQATPKYDGLELFFHLTHDGGGFIVNRAGRGRRITHNSGCDIQFNVEYCGGFYILTRVFGYKGFVPWHNVNCMQQFVSSLNFDIAGDALFWPGHPSLIKLPTDGLIMRRGEQDYRVKSYVGVDLDARAWRKFESYFEHHDIDFYIDVKPNGNAEYDLSIVDGVHTFKRLRDRKDKATTSKVSDIRHLLRASGVDGVKLKHQ